MKIGLVCPYAINRGGGVKEITFAMYEELTRRGHEVHIITPRPRDYNETPPNHILFVGTCSDFNWPVQHTTVQVSSVSDEDIEELFRAHKFDVLHVHEPWVPTIGRQILAQATCATVATFHAALPGSMSRAFVKAAVPYTKPVLKNIDELVATGEPATEYVCSLTDRPVAIIPIGVDQTFYHSPKQHRDNRKHKTVFYVGRLENRKGAKYLIKAFQLLQAKHPDTELLIASDGPDREKLEMLAEDLKIKDVHFLGYISNDEKAKLMRNSDLYCAPALYGEGVGLVLLEAMASGCVTVAGDNPGYATVLQGLGAVSLVHPKHSAEFARRLELMLYEPELRKLWRAWAETELPNYHYKHITDQYEEIYGQAIKDRTSRD
ncbi:MAG TPA: glycosyltransferase family 4 protein [Candidatus Saccharimonadales bacterium]